MSVTSEEKLVAKLENKAYREAYVIEHVKTSVPLQIHHLREQRDLTQAQMAEQAKTTQTVISRLEDPNYGNLTVNSLLKIASALDIGLLIKFVPFSRLLVEFQDLSPQALSARPFTEELAMLKKWAAKKKDEEIAAQAKNTSTSPISRGIPTALEAKSLGKDRQPSEGRKSERLQELLTSDNRQGVVLQLPYSCMQMTKYERGGMPNEALGNFSR